MHCVTLAELLQFCLVLLGLAGLMLTAVSSIKKEVRPSPPPAALKILLPSRRCRLLVASPLCVLYSLRPTKSNGCHTM